MAIEVDTYWCWEGQPAIICDYGKFFGGFLLNKDTNTWTRVTERDVVDWFKDGREMTKEEFEESFGEVGVRLPRIPSA